MIVENVQRVHDRVKDTTLIFFNLLLLQSFHCMVSLLIDTLFIMSFAPISWRLDNEGNVEAYVDIPSHNDDGSSESSSGHPIFTTPKRYKSQPIPYDPTEFGSASAPIDDSQAARNPSLSHDLRFVHNIRFVHNSVQTQ